MKLSGPKAHDFAARPAANIWAVIISCEDEGLAAELGETLYAAWAAREPAERITLTEEDLARDAALLFERLEARSLLGERPILLLQLASERQSKYLVEAIEAAEARPGRYEAGLIIMTGELKKTSKLRKTAESAKFCAALQVFQDSDEDLAELARAQLARAGVTIDEAALARFLSALPSNRRLVRTELEKLELYARNLGRALTLDDITALSSSHSETDIADLIDTALTGQAGQMLAELDRLQSTNTSAITILRALQRDAVRLLDARHKGVGSSAAAKQLRPPVWPDQWPVFRKKLSVWNEARLIRLIGRIEACEAQVKSAGPIGDASIRLFLNDVARAATAS